MKTGDIVKYGKRVGTVIDVVDMNIAKIRFHDNNLVDYKYIDQLQIVPEINYEKLLDDWAEDVLREANSAEEKLEDIDLLEKKYRYGYSKGFAEGLRLAVAKLTQMEKKLKG